MYKKILLLIIIFFISSGSFVQVHGQMMMNSGNPSVTVDPTQLQQQKQEEAQGKQLFDKLQNKQTTCEKLTDSDFEKIGEYTMSQMFGNNTSSHVAMNERIEQMRGQTGEEQMHVQIGKNVTGCSTTSSQNSTLKGGGFNMMGWGGYGYNGMMNGNFGWVFGIVHFVFALAILIDLILAGVWLWQQIRSPKRK